MIDTMAAYDTAILLSGDSDFSPLIKYVQKRGKKVLVVSSRDRISKELVEASDKFMWFNWFKKEWELG